MLFFNDVEFAQEHLDDCSIVFNINSKDIFLLNSTSSFIFKKLQEQNNINDIVNEYISEHESVEYNVLYEDFVTTKNKLLEMEILYEK